MKKIAIMTLLISAAGCGNSPLFNHRDEPVPPTNDTVAVPAHPVGTGPAFARTARDCKIEFPVNGLCAAMDWNIGPASDQESSFTLQFFNKADGSPREVDNEVFVQLWMPAMGHGSSPTQVTVGGSGVYYVTRVYFTMQGAWDIRFQLKKNGAITEQVITSVEI